MEKEMRKTRKQMLHTPVNNLWLCMKTAGIWLFTSLLLMNRIQAFQRGMCPVG